MEVTGSLAMMRSRRSGGIRVHISLLNAVVVGFSDTTTTAADSCSHGGVIDDAGFVIWCAFVRAMIEKEEQEEEEEEEGDGLGGASMATG